MVNMQMTPQEAKAEYGTEPPASDLPRYPWGLELRLDTEILAKLGMSMPTVGTIVSISAIAKVVGTSSRETEGGESRQCVELQITDMEKPATGPATPVEDRLYGPSA